MIELITGTPGAGKTTYAVATRLAAEVKRTVPIEPETCAKLGLDVGTVIQRRLVVAGIRGLSIEHERLPHLLTRDASSSAEVEKWNALLPGSEGDPVHQRLPGEPVRDVPAILQNWWLWCRPGDLIVVDEAQFVMPRGTLGRKPPYWLQAMEVHRHYGVDFLLITQHPQLIDTTVRALVGLHRHVRAVMGSSVCMVYTWDHASNPERYGTSTKGTFVRRRSHYRLFHSTVAVVKPPSAGRWGLVVAPLLLAVGLGGLAFKVHGWTKGGGPSSSAAAASAAADSSAVVAGDSREPRPGRRGRPAGFVDVPDLAGCFAQGSACRCMSREGAWVAVEASMCRLTSSSFDGLVKWAPRPVPAEVAAPAARPASSPGLFSQRGTL